MNKFIPNAYYKDIKSIDYKKLKKLGINTILFDLDNTIGNIYENICSKENEIFINKLSKEFNIFVTSNNNTKRVKLFCSNLNCNYKSWCLKPTRIGLYYVIKKYKLDRDKIAIVGDQITTDIVVGNRLKIKTILVDPILNKDLKISGLNRKFEIYINKKNNLIRGEYYDKL